mmetsp:Transcript_11271/g.30456  ORF Transcript_11271/g.30456 Transcript_11271/m.30456 type:complete len:321 (+) Transcript_11271:1699-2661(+)
MRALVNSSFSARRAEMMAVCSSSMAAHRACMMSYLASAASWISLEDLSPRCTSALVTSSLEASCLASETILSRAEQMASSWSSMARTALVHARSASLAPGSAEGTCSRSVAMGSSRMRRASRLASKRRRRSASAAVAFSSLDRKSRRSRASSSIMAAEGRDPRMPCAAVRCWSAPASTSSTESTDRAMLRASSASVPSCRRACSRAASPPARCVRSISSRSLSGMSESVSHAWSACGRSMDSSSEWAISACACAASLMSRTASSTRLVKTLASCITSNGTSSVNGSSAAGLGSMSGGRTALATALPSTGGRPSLEGTRSL